MALREAVDRLNAAIERSEKQRLVLGVKDRAVRQNGCLRVTDGRARRVNRLVVGRMGPCDAAGHGSAELDSAISPASDHRVLGASRELLRVAGEVGQLARVQISVRQHTSDLI